MTRRISTGEIAARCIHLSPDEQDSYKLMLDGFISLDARSGTHAEFHVTSGQSTLLCYRKTSPALMSERDPKLREQPEAIVMGLNYSLAAQRLVAMSLAPEAIKIDLVGKIKQTENNFIHAVNACEHTSDQSPELIRESFIRDDLAMLLALYRTQLPNDTPISDVRKAVKYLDITKNWMGLGLEPYQLKTRGTIEDSEGDIILCYERVDKPIARTSEALKAEYADCESTIWFQTLSPLEQALTKSYQKVLTKDGHIIPSQLRVSLIGPFNVSQTITRVKSPGEIAFRPIATSTHTASNVPANPKLPDDERLRLTQLVQENLEQQLGSRGLDIVSLLSQTGDRFLMMKDHFKKQVPGTYLDAIITEFTQKAAELNERIQSNNLCFNQFRFGEDDRLDGIDNQINIAKALIGYIRSLSKTLTAHLKQLGETETKADIENSRAFIDNLHERESRLASILTRMNTLIEQIKSRVAHANEITKANAPAPALVKLLMTAKAKDEGVNTGFIDHLTGTELRRIALKQATDKSKTTKRKIHTAFNELDGALHGAKLLFEYSRLLEEMWAVTSTFKEEYQKAGIDATAADDTTQLFKSIGDTPVPALVFNCASGENRTLGFDIMHAVFSIWKHMCQTDWDETEKEALLKHIFDTLIHDEHMQLRAGSVFGSAAGTIGLREKSKDSAMTHPAFHGDVISNMYRRSADAKSIRKNLIPLRNWWLHCYTILNSTIGGTSSLRNFPEFKKAHMEIGDLLKSNTAARISAADAKVIKPKTLSKPMKSLFNGIKENCSKHGVFANTPLHHHPLWRVFEEGLALETLRKKCEEKAKNAWDAFMALDKKQLPTRKRRALLPPPILNKTILKRDKQVMALRSFVHFHGWVTIEGAQSTFEQSALGDLAKQAVESLNKVYQKFRFSPEHVLRQRLQLPLEVLFQAWRELEAQDGNEQASEAIAKKFKPLLASITHPAQDVASIIRSFKAKEPFLPRSASAPNLTPRPREKTEESVMILSEDADDLKHKHTSLRLSQNLTTLFQQRRQSRAHTMGKHPNNDDNTAGGRPNSIKFMAFRKRITKLDDPTIKRFSRYQDNPSTKRFSRCIGPYTVNRSPEP